MISDKVTAVVLAGGGSTRMGYNKALMKLGNMTMIERVIKPLENIFENIIVVTNDEKEYTMLNNVKFTRDYINIEEKNSLIGLYSGLKDSNTLHIFVIGCDMPFLNTDLVLHMINSLKDEDVIIPFVNGYYEPLYAIYSKRCIPEFEKLLEKKWYKIIDAFNNIAIKRIVEDDVKKFDPSMRCFENINTYQQFLQYKDIFE